MHEKSTLPTHPHQETAILRSNTNDAAVGLSKRLSNMVNVLMEKGHNRQSYMDNWGREMESKNRMEIEEMKNSNRCTVSSTSSSLYLSLPKKE
jgi:hypothetical protein